MPLLSLKFVPGRALPLLLMLMACFAASLPAALADEQGWVLTQRSDMVGDQYVYVAPSGVKLVNPKIGYNVILCAPDWNVCLYNDKTKLFYSVSYTQWIQEIRKQMGHHTSDLKSGNWVKGAPTTICGMKASTYTMQGSPQRHLRNASCCVSSDIVVPRQITELLAESYGLPDNKAFPLKVNSVSTSGKLTVQLDTYNSQACAIPASYFYMPQGYTRVNSKEEVMVDDDTKQILRDLANDSPGSSASAAAPRQQQTFQQQTYQQPVASQYSQPPAQQTQQPQQAAAPATPGVIQLPNGQTLDREKMKKIIEAIKSGGKVPGQTPTTP